MLDSMTGHLRNISGGPNLSLELVILIIKVKNITFIAKMAVWYDTAVSILKIKEAFPALPNKKILKIHNTAFSKPDNKGQKIQPITKGPSRKQAIVPASNKLMDIIIGEANTCKGTSRVVLSKY